MNARTVSYVVTYSDEAGNVVDRRFTPDQRDAAIELFRDLAAPMRAANAIPAIPTDDTNMERHGAWDEHTDQHGTTVTNYDNEMGNQTAGFYAMVTVDPMVEAADADAPAPTDEAPTGHYVIITPDAPVETAANVTADEADARLIAAAMAYARRSGRSFGASTVTVRNEWIAGSVRFIGGATVTLVQVARP